MSETTSAYVFAAVMVDQLAKSTLAQALGKWLA